MSTTVSRTDDSARLKRHEPHNFSFGARAREESLSFEQTTMTGATLDVDPQTHLRLHKTERFYVWSSSNTSENAPMKNGSCLITSSNESSNTTKATLPVMKISHLMLHERNGTTHDVRETLWNCLEHHGFVVLTLPKSSSACKIVQELHKSLGRDYFPSDDNNATTRTSRESTVKNHLSSGNVYQSERGVPMWRLGYELCDDGVREAFRVHAGSPDSQPFPTRQARRVWLDTLVLCREICDAALRLTLGYDSSKHLRVDWKRKAQERPGDYSVMYAMNYFNDKQSEAQAQQNGITSTEGNSNTATINVKQHVDPSLFVLEPFLASTVGLQVLDQKSQEWITCDGPTSPIHSVLDKEEAAMVLFVGKAFCANAPVEKSVQPTLHRVVMPSVKKRRVTMIYEQKYQEYFPPPTLD